MPRTSAKQVTAVTVVGIDIGKNVFHLIGLDKHGRIALRAKLTRGQLDAQFANMPPCLVGMEACNGAHHLSRKLNRLGHDARIMPAQYVKAFLKGNKNDFRDAEAIAEAVQRPTSSSRLRLRISSICRLCIGFVRGSCGSVRL